MEMKWYAVYTKPRWEKKVAENLCRTGVEYFCPLNKVLRKWSDRNKIVYEPLFTSYVFVRTTEKNLDKIKQINGIVCVVTWLGKPAIIMDNEIETIRQFLNSHQNVRVEKCLLRPNDQVRIINGLFREQEGKVLKLNNNSVKVELASLGFVMIAEVDTYNIIISNKV